MNNVSLIFGHKLHRGTPYRGKRFLIRQIPHGVKIKTIKLVFAAPHIMTRTSHISMRWWCYPLCTRSTRLLIFHSASSLMKQLSVGRYIAPFGYIILIPSHSLCLRKAQKSGGLLRWMRSQLLQLWLWDLQQQYRYEQPTIQFKNLHWFDFTHKYHTPSNVIF
jgi:hypothetical protein